MLNPSRADFKLSDYLLKIIEWRNDLCKFFKDMTGLDPRPFQAEFFKEVQEMRSKNIVIVAGRGIGKTLSLAIVALWYAFVLSITERRPFKVVILAGGLDQAKICFNYVMEFINSQPLLQRHLAKEPTQKEILFKDGSWIRPLPASEKSIRGHHPDLLIIDEAAVVDDEIIYAALPMTAPSPYARQIFSTTPTESYSWIIEKWEHQAEYKYPDWKFFNWNAESFLPKEQIELLKKMLPAHEYATEIQGLPYKREGKVFRIEDLKACLEDLPVEPKDGTVYAGIDWGYYPAPTVLTIVRQEKDGTWRVLYSEAYLAESFEEVHKKVKVICDSYNVVNVFTDSTDKGENMRLAAEGLPVEPVSFKGEKSQMISNLRSLVEQHRLKIDPHRFQRLIQQMLDYVYDSKRNDDFVDSLMLAVRPNLSTLSPRYSLLDILKEISTPTTSVAIEEDTERKEEIRKKLLSLGRLEHGIR